MKSATKKEKKDCWLGLYVLANKALLPLSIKTNQGYFDVEPVHEFDYRNRDQLITSLDSAIRIGNPAEDAPAREKQKERTPMEKLAGAKSWAELERKSIHFSIEVYAGEYVISCAKRAPDGTWSRDKERAFSVTIPRDTGAEGISDAILEHLKTRTDLPGLPLGQQE